MRCSIVTAITLSLAIVIPAHAQTLASGEKLASFLDNADKELSQGNRNFLDMMTGMQDAEYRVSLIIYDATASAQGGFDRLYLVVSIYTQMKDNRDISTVKKYVRQVASSTVRASDTALKHINQNVVNLRSPVAITEAQRIRDLIQKIRDEIQRTVPGS